MRVRHSSVVTASQVVPDDAETSRSLSIDDSANRPAPITMTTSATLKIPVRTGPIPTFRKSTTLPRAVDRCRGSKTRPRFPHTQGAPCPQNKSGQACQRASSSPRASSPDHNQSSSGQPRSARPVRTHLPIMLRSFVGSLQWSNVMDEARRRRLQRIDAVRASSPCGLSMERNVLRDAHNRCTPCRACVRGTVLRQRAPGSRLPA